MILKLILNVVACGCALLAIRDAVASRLAGSIIWLAAAIGALAAVGILLR